MCLTIGIRLHAILLLKRPMKKDNNKLSRLKERKNITKIIIKKLMSTTTQGRVLKINNQTRKIKN